MASRKPDLSFLEPKPVETKELRKGVTHGPGGYVIDTGELFEFLPKIEQARRSAAKSIFLIGGQGSGKSVGSLQIAINDYCLSYECCDVLILRKTFAELERGMLSDLKTICPEQIYKYNASKNIATFTNGSRIFFGHLASGKESDLATYLSSSFYLVIIDESTEFSTTALQLISARARGNPGCKPNAQGKYPIPKVISCSNPRGPYWHEWRALYRDQKPVWLGKDAKKDKNNRWWVKEAGEWRLVHDCNEYKLIHSTLLDNPFLMAKNPRLYADLDALPPDLRKKMLFGDMDSVSGVYYDCFSPDKHVKNLREDPDVVLFEEWQPKVIGIDWGRAHACAITWITRARVKQIDGSYKYKLVFYREHVEKGLTGKQIAEKVIRLSRNPDGPPEKIAAIYFSHEQFSKKWEEHSPAEELSKILMDAGLPAVTRGTQDRVGRASFLYSQLFHGDLVMLDSCPQLALAIPSLVRDDKRPEDVLKTPTDADDIYDSASLAAFGHFCDRPKPQAVKEQERIANLSSNPFAQKLEILKQHYTAQRKQELAQMPTWLRRIEEAK